MNNILKVFLLLLLGIILGFAISIITIDLFISTTIGSKDFYFKTFEKANYGLKDIVKDNLPDTFTPNVKTELGKDIEIYGVDFLTYLFGTSKDFIINLDENKYAQMLSKDMNIPAEFLVQTIAQQKTGLTKQINLAKEKVKPVHEVFSILLSLLIVAIAVLIVTIVLFFLITGDLRSFSSWIGNFLTWPALIALLPLVCIRYIFDYDTMLKAQPISAEVASLLTIMITQLLDKLVLIIAITFFVGLVIWIVHFFLPKKEVVAKAI